MIGPMASTGFLTGLRASTSSLRPRTPRSSPSIRHFSSTAPAAVGKPVLVELLKRVPGLGEPGDRVEVVSGRARLRLVPGRKARLVPFAAKFRIGPKKAEPKPEPVQKVKAPTPKSKDTPFVPLTPTSDDLSVKLSQLPPVLDYNLQTMDPNSNILLNTFTLADIQASLDDVGLTTDQVITKWKDGASDRIERIGERLMIVQVRGKGLEQKEVTVRVHKTYDEATSWGAEQAEGPVKRGENVGARTERAGRSKEGKVDQDVDGQDRS